MLWKRHAKVPVMPVGLRSEFYLDSRQLKLILGTGLGHARNSIVVRAGLVVVAIGGAYGTLSEIGHALSDEIPVVGLNTWSFNIGGSEDNSLHMCDTPSQAVETALLLANKRLNKCDN